MILSIIGYCLLAFVCYKIVVKFPVLVFIGILLACFALIANKHLDHAEQKYCKAILKTMNPSGKLTVEQLHCLKQ